MMNNDLKLGVCAVAAVIFLFCAVGGLSGAEKKPPSISEIDFEFAKSLKEREDAVRQREKQLEEQEKMVAEVQREVDEKLARLVALQTEVKGQIEELGTSKDVQFRNLIKVYSAMSSTKLAPLLNKMEDKTVAKVLRAMKADAVAKIIPKLDQDKAVSVSKNLGMLNDMNLN